LRLLDVRAKVCGEASGRGRVVRESEATHMAKKKNVSVKSKAAKLAGARKATSELAARTVAEENAAATKMAVRQPTAKPARSSRGKTSPGKRSAVKTSAPKAAGAKSQGATAPAPQTAAKPAAEATAQPKNLAAAVGKPAQSKISAPVTPKDIAVKTAEARNNAQVAKKPVNQRHGFRTNEYVVYPAHGVGRIVGIEEQEIAGMSLELFVITFDKDKMTLRVPTSKLESVGMRKLADENVVKKAMETLKGRARIKRTMWSRRAQEYEAKINSGDLVSIAEVVRDLYRSETQPEQSYSERQLYEAALDRMAREVAVVEKIDERGAVQRITEVLSKSARGRRLAAEGGEAADAGVKAA
jgi:CarD family transcriptional regulator